MLESFSQAVRGKLTGMERAKIVALVTIEVHARDIIDKLFKMGCSSRNVFEWLSQLRFYWEEDDCTVKQTNTSFEYMYEYLGNSGRLVITPLTDRWVRSSPWMFCVCVCVCVCACVRACMYMHTCVYLCV